MNLCVVVVVYNQRYDETKSFYSIAGIANLIPNLDLDVIIYDNSPNAQDVLPSHLFHNLVYCHDARNIGVVPAYIYARDYCYDNHIDWLLRLDQDSGFGEDFFNEFMAIVVKSDVRVVVPKILCDETIISPSFTRIGGMYKAVSENYEGITPKKLTFINSMSFLKITDPIVSKALASLVYQLDLSDHEFANLLPISSVYVLKTKVSHSLSVREKGYVSIERYNLILRNEIEFMNRSEGFLGRFIFKLRLLLRTVKFCSKGMYKYASITIASLIQNL